MNIRSTVFGVKTCENQGELVKVIGEDLMLLSDGTKWKVENSEYCLCPMNVSGIAEALNQNVATDCMNWYFGSHVSEIPEGKISNMYYCSRNTKK